MVGSFTKLTTSLLTSHELARTFSAKLCAVCQLPSDSEDVFHFESYDSKCGYFFVCGSHNHKCAVFFNARYVNF